MTDYLDYSDSSPVEASATAKAPQEAAPTNRLRRHWYHTAAVTDAPPTVKRRRMTARERMRLRHERNAKGGTLTIVPSLIKKLPRVASSLRTTSSLLPRQFPTLNKTHWAVLGGILLLVLAFIVFNGRQPNPLLTANMLTASAAPTLAPTPDIQAWKGQQRFTILVMGLDKRPGEEGTGFRTDSLILLSIDPRTRRVGILSIPRDVYVPIPNRNVMQSINSAYVLGELERPGVHFGAELTVQTVEYNLGIKIDGYAVVSFDTVVYLVDSIGGIDVDVPETIDDPEFPDMNYGYDPLFIPAGHIHMDGKLALKFARTRHQGNDDYDRTKRQQQVILALRQKALQTDVLPGLVAQAPMIWDRVSQGLITNLKFDQLLGLAWYAKDISTENIHRGTLEGNTLQAMQYEGNNVLTINRVTIIDLLTQVFGPDYNR